MVPSTGLVVLRGMTRNGVETRERGRGREREYPVSALELLSQPSQLLQLPLPHTPNEVLGGGPWAIFIIQSEFGLHNIDSACVLFLHLVLTKTGILDF